jgi:hypothetical protein
MGFGNTFGNIRKANDSAGTDWEHRHRNDRQSWGLFIVAGDARDAVIIAAEDGWQDTVGPRLQVAGADLTDGHVFSVGDNGEGVPGVS